MWIFGIVSLFILGSARNPEHLLTRTQRSISGSYDEPTSEPNMDRDDLHYGPYFDNSTERNVTVQPGKTAYLHCGIKQLGNRTVSWVRQRDLRVYTFGKYESAFHGRFTPIHTENSDTWTLQIQYTQKEDAGVYECQVSTEPKMSLSIRLNVVDVIEDDYLEDQIYPILPLDNGMSTFTRDMRNDTKKSGPTYFFHDDEDGDTSYDDDDMEINGARSLLTRLSKLDREDQLLALLKAPVVAQKSSTVVVPSREVIVPKAHISEGSNLYIQSGSTINLTCIITESPFPPVYNLWYHDDRMINYDSSRSGTRWTKENGYTIVSWLRIQNARPTDSGNYSCQTSYVDPANITVHVLNGSDSNPEHLLTRTEINFGGSNDEPTSEPNMDRNDLHYGPYFDNSTELNVTVQPGKAAYLHCKIRQLGDKTVAWVRQRDMQVLTLGEHTYTSDQRFTSFHLKNLEIWMLQIKSTQMEDAGVYECLVTTEPKMSLSIRLNVVVPKAHISEGSNLYIQSGSTMNLTCIITESKFPPDYIWWYHDNRMINYDSSIGGIRLTTENRPTTVSRLRIQNARPTDSGNYSCEPSYADPANIYVHVLNGENRAAVHGVISSNVANTMNTIPTLLAALLCSIVQTSTLVIRI